jgi:hemerythrin-like domain-containing protein
MLAAECAWAILRADHAELRRHLGAIADAAGAGVWRDAEPAMGRVKQLIESLQSFDHASHRPKGVALLKALRGRSPDADRLLAEMEQERDADDALLNQAIARLDAAAQGEARAGVECAALLARHRERVLHHLDDEETLLCAQTERLLTEEEWARVVSSISTKLYP